VRPLRDADSTLLASYEAIFSARRFAFVELTEGVVERATTLRALHGFKTPDSLHLAAALEARADVFLTGDAQLARCTALRVTVVAP
jgi:predicted nucleic acid-binding protein